MLVYKDNFSKTTADNFDCLKFFEEIIALPLFQYLEHGFDLYVFDCYVKKFQKFEHIVHLGTGGSSLGPQAIIHAMRNSRKKFDFFDNIDPLLFVEKLKNLDFSKVGIVVASKSGNTAETLVQLATILNLMQEQSLDIRKHLIFICQTDGNALHEFAVKNEISVIPHNNGIGGRFAVFSEVGLFPGLLAGFDMLAFRNGAFDLWQEILKLGLSHSIVKAALFLANSKLHPVNFIYSERLRLYGAWFAQLWAESLGKTNELGNRFGTTPLLAMGAVDQHSQLQLYLGGPFDKFFTFIETKDHIDLKVADLGLKSNSYIPLNGKSLSDLFNAEFLATYKTLVGKNIPARCISIDKVDMYNLGQIMMASIIETLITAKIWQINAFDQPAVEEGKILAIKIIEEKF